MITIRIQSRRLGCIALLTTIVTSLGGCFYETRPARTAEQMLASRSDEEVRLLTDTRGVLSKLLARCKTEHDRLATDPAASKDGAPTIDVLVVSGGGDWGAFGAGFLKGWGNVPKDHPLARPEFDAVTGVSTGALIAPFAFIGDEESFERIDHLYRHPESDWVRTRGLLYFLPSNISFAEVPGLERVLRANMPPERVRQIAAVGDGRVLAVNTTNVDYGYPRVFDLVDEARKATAFGDERDTEALDRFYTILLASAGIPGVFPFRIIDNEMYVDGGITGNIIYGGRLGEADSLPAMWQAAYPGLPMPKIRYWVIFNNHILPPPQVTQPNWPAVIQRSMEMATRAATLTAMRHLQALAEISELRRGAEIEVRIVAIPGDWIPPIPGVFIAESMNNLADLGQRMGADPASWRTDPLQP